jgi:UDP-4-amino-4,6-dideoxy-N-acetyl-beta-L-altrosamine transaminase
VEQNLMDFIPYGRQEISDQDIQAVVDVLRSSHLTQGEAVPTFESSMARRVESSFAVATNSATSALHITCLGLGLGPGDILWTSPISFVASANCGLYCGATVDFVDVDPATGRMCTSALRKKLEKSEATGTLPKIVIPVHLGGNSCDMKTIKRLGDRYDFKIIEDASHAVGATYEEQPVGGCQYSDAVVFSFHPVKIITSGEGGMVTTNDHDLALALQMLRSHGITRDSAKLLESSAGAWYYEQHLLGLNYRLSDIHAALGNSQLGRLNQFLDQRRQLVQAYNVGLQALPVGTPNENELETSSWHLYAIRINQDGPTTRRELYDALSAKNIGVNVHYIPIYRQPFFGQLKMEPTDFPGSESYYESALTIPLHPGISKETIGHICNEISRALG